MQTLHDIFYFGGTFFVFILIIGIIRPHLVLFWTEDKDRSRVLKTFGPIIIIMLIGGFVTSNYIDEDKTFRDEENNNQIRKEDRADPDRVEPRPEFSTDDKE